MGKAALCLALLCAVAFSGCAGAPAPPSRPVEKVNRRDGSVLVLVPGGAFTMGSGEYRDSKPMHEVRLGDYYIGRDEVTNRRFALFVKSSGYRPEGAWRKFFRPGMEEHPVVSVSWYDALAYCRWAQLRLPTEAEWEKAARGRDRRLYPWGDVWDPERCNNRAMSRPGARARMASLHKGRGTTPVGSFPDGASPSGALDMAGNAYEWTSSAFNPYPYRSGDGREGQDDPVEVALRGGSWAYDNVGFFRTDTRSRCKPPIFSFVIGFRVAASPDAPLDERSGATASPKASGEGGP